MRKRLLTLLVAVLLTLGVAAPALAGYTTAYIPGRTCWGSDQLVFYQFQNTSGSGVNIVSVSYKYGVHDSPYALDPYYTPVSGSRVLTLLPGQLWQHIVTSPSGVSKVFSYYFSGGSQYSSYFRFYSNAGAPNPSVVLYTHGCIG
jgi:hypothetical protein